MTCNSCNTCNFGTTTTQTTIESVSWAQITPLLMNADSIILEKFKVDSKGVITQDDKRWALTNIEWNFAPLAEAKSTFTIKPLPPKSEAVVQNDSAPDTPPDTTTGQDDDDEVVEVFDFLSGVFKIYYDSKTQQIFGEVETNEAGLMVTYRYMFHFYGKQKVEYSDLLEYRNTDDKATSALNGKDNIINRVIAL